MSARHEMILASAGSGKTHALTHRFVKLLAHGAVPERIVALTFTRKAAGEFFDKILEKLASAATDAAKAHKLAAEIDAPHLGPADFLRMLRATVDAMPRLNLGTLDGFFARVVTSFPLELGLDGEFAIMEDAAARRERRRVLRRMFAAAGEPDAAQREFIEAFKRATFGVEEKQLSRVLDSFLDDHAETFLDAPGVAQWGDAARIWPEGSPWLAATDQRTSAAAALHAALPWETLNEKQRARLENFFAALSEWSPGAPLPKPVEYLLGNAFDASPELKEIVVERKKVPLDPAAREALAGVIAGIAGAELQRRLEMTRGLFAVLRGYERSYHESVRRAGRLTFADVLRLLLPGADAPVLAGAGGVAVDREGARLLIDWRLDAKFDHWLLDEFQDTSFAQWSVLRNLIDEAVQDAEQKRSLFYVGDVKQAIFAWRGGDPRLFREIFEHYNEIAADTIGEGRLDASWRSGPAVIAMVNQVFGDESALRELLPAATVAAWMREWRAHTSAQPGRTGWAELLHAEDEAGRFAETLRILKETTPIERGLEAAVLVRTNGTAAALADYLRREGGIDAVAESDLHVATDNPLSAALLALLRVAAHPGDTLAWEHVQMTPLAHVLAAEDIRSGDALTVRLLTEIHALGFSGTLEAWLRRLAPVLAGDRFSQERGEMLVAAAVEFDAEGSRDVADFLEFAARYTLRDADAAGVVRVMTVHKSKGLGFDLVILPDLEGKTLAARRDGLAVQKSAERVVEWVLDLPAKLFVERDPVLAAHLAAAEADAAYENLCLLYVAMTRAKRAMYIITEPIGAKSVSRNFPRLLRETLGETWTSAATGDPRWFETIAPPETRAEHGAGIVLLDERAGDRMGAPRIARHPARTPSALKTGMLDGAQLFAFDGGRAADFGHTLHERLSEIEWVGEEGGMRLTAAWVNDANNERERGEVSAAANAPDAHHAPDTHDTPDTNDALDPHDAGHASEAAAIAEARACVLARALAAVWARPSAHAEVWRERAFEIVLEGDWVTGVFDRVVVERDARGRALRATVYDFKTDRVEDSRAGVALAVERHAAQLNLYRRVVAAFTGLRPEAVSCELVLTRLRRRAVIPTG